MIIFMTSQRFNKEHLHVNMKKALSIKTCPPHQKTPPYTASNRDNWPGPLIILGLPSWLVIDLVLIGEQTRKQLLRSGSVEQDLVEHTPHTQAICS